MQPFVSCIVWVHLQGTCGDRGGLLLCDAPLPTTPPWVRAQGPVLRVSGARQGHRGSFAQGNAGDVVQ